MTEPLLTRYLQPLLAGRRSECFELLRTALTQGWSAEKLLRQIIAPSTAQVLRLYRDDRINTAIEHMAIRINRAIADQLGPALPASPSNGRRIVICCADGEPEELGAQIACDLFSAAGWETYFPGGGVPNDEIHSLVGQINPHILLIFGTRPEGVPGVRRLVEMIREIGVGQTMNIIVAGGIYGRAEGLWQEVGADVVADSAEEALAIARDLGPRAPQPMPMGVVKKRRRRKRTAVAPNALALASCT